MCLQWCHVRAWLIDNDLRCTGCARGVAAALPPAWSCANCRHERRREGMAHCALTRETLPLIGRCCHWQVEPHAADELVIGDADVAPWLVGTASALFAASPSAPPIRFADGRVVVARDALSVPLVYGVPADEWDAALGWDVAGPEDSEPLLDAASERAISGVLAALEQDAVALTEALAQLAELLGPAGAAALPPTWRSVLEQILVLSRERADEHPSLAAQLDQWQKHAMHVALAGKGSSGKSTLAAQLDTWEND